MGWWCELRKCSVAATCTQHCKYTGRKRVAIHSGQITPLLVKIQVNEAFEPLNHCWECLETVCLKGEDMQAFQRCERLRKFSQ
mmetsp:Transcript_248/g.585  ORF Transcript_248/g.585 Transcript_248/m.585 type:complete len:83 (-) Transcript_248:132-380(-)